MSAMLVWALGGLLVVLGVVLVGASLLRRGGAAENPTLWLVSGLVMTALGVVAISAAALAGDGDSGDGGDRVAAGTRTTASPGESGPAEGDQGDDRDGGGDRAPGDARGSSGPSDDWDDSDGDPSEDDAAVVPELPACFDQHLSDEPVVAEADHRRLEEGVDQQLLVTMHAADAIALVLVESGDLLGVMRIGDQAVPADDTLHVYDVVDAACQPVAFTPQDTDDDVAQTHRTVVPLDLAGRRYEVDFLQTGLTPELDVILRRVP